MKQIAYFCFVCITVTACGTQTKYRGVSEQAWHQLTAEQKQIIIDNDFQTFMNSSKNKGNKQ